LIKSTDASNGGECLYWYFQSSVNKCKKRCKFQRKQGPTQKQFKRNAGMVVPSNDADEDIEEVITKDRSLVQITSECHSEKLLLQEADEDMVISESLSEELHMLEANGNVENYSEELEADGGAAISETYCEKLLLQEDKVMLEHRSEDLVFQETHDGIENLSEELTLQKGSHISQDLGAVDGTATVNNMQIKPQTGVCREDMHY